MITGTLQVRAHGTLNYFLPPIQRDQWVTVAFRGRQTLKHLIESSGIPHLEICSLRVDGQPAGLNDLARENSAVEVMPYAPGDARLRPAAVRFILDGHLGKLASYLRILGFDVLYVSSAEDDWLAATSAAEKRILLSRDRGLLKRRMVEYGYCVRDSDPHLQLQEVVLRYNLVADARPFSRCPRCNGLLRPAEEAEVAGQLLDGTREHFHSFWQCANCRQVYWQGSHYERLEALLEAILPNR